MKKECMKHPKEALTATYDEREPIRIISLELPGILFHTLWADSPTPMPPAPLVSDTIGSMMGGAVDSDCVID
jgi:hypothetical protein